MSSDGLSWLWLAGFIAAATPAASLLFYWAFLQNMKAFRHPEPMPVPGFEAGARALEADEAEWEGAGFRRAAAFVLRSTPAGLVHLYTHRSEPVYAGRYWLNGKITVDFVSNYEEDWGLSTGDAGQAGSFPRKPRDLVQLFVGAGRGLLWEEHLRAHAFLVSRGALPRPIPAEQIQDYFLRSCIEQCEVWRQVPLWPLRAFVWATLKPGARKRRHSIEEQYARGWLPVVDELKRAT